MQLGAKHVESPYIELGQICTAYYFAHFLVIVPIISSIENSLIELARTKKEYLYDGSLNNTQDHKEQSPVFAFEQISKDTSNISIKLPL